MKSNSADNKIHIGFYANRILREVERRIDNAIAEYGITGKQARLLCYIKKKSAESDVYQRDIEEVFCIRRSSVTSILQNLEKSGFIIRTGDKKDGRVKKLRITAKGIEVLDKVTIEIDKIENKIKNLISEEELNRFIEFADEILETLKD